MDIKNDYFDRDRLEDIVDEIIIEHDEDEDADRHLIDMALQLSQQRETNNRTKYNRKHNHIIFPIPHAKILPSTSVLFNAVYIIICLAFPGDPPSMQ